MAEPVSVTQEFLWNIENTLTVSRTFTWSVGDGPLHWYRVEAHPRRLADGTATGAAICSGPCEKACEVQHVMASSVQHLCERLRELKFVGKIKKVYRFSRPALECDALRQQVGSNTGIFNHECTVPEEVDFCECECLPFVYKDPSNPLNDDCPGLLNTGMTWYTEYLHITPTVVVGQHLHQYQRVGFVALQHLHFGLGDGLGGGNVGQTLDLDDFFGLSKTGGRPSGQAPARPFGLSADCVCYIKKNTVFPLDRYRCQYCEETMAQPQGCWHQHYGSGFHDAEEYYAMDLYCPRPGDIETGVLTDADARDSGGAEVYNACGAADITTEVIQAQSGLPPPTIGVVILKHTRLDVRSDPPCQALTTSFAPVAEAPHILSLTSGDVTREPPVTCRGGEALMAPPLETVLTACGSHRLPLKMYGSVGPERFTLFYDRRRRSWRADFLLTGQKVMCELACGEEGWLASLTALGKGRLAVGCTPEAAWKGRRFRLALKLQGGVATVQNGHVTSFAASGVLKKDMDITFSEREI